jgi:hypothetical protein
VFKSVRLDDNIAIFSLYFLVSSVESERFFIISVTWDWNFSVVSKCADEPFNCSSYTLFNAARFLDTFYICSPNDSPSAEDEVIPEIDTDALS